MRAILSKYFFLMTLLLLASCTSFGPKVMKLERYNYNMAMDYSSRQELLLNLVRLRYDEGPTILQVGNISASSRLDFNASSTGNVFFPSTAENNTNEMTVGAGTLYSTNPIISYTPLNTRSFNSQFLSELSLHDIAILLESSWSISRVFRVTLQQAGRAVNAPSSARATSSHIPQYQDFLDMVQILRQLQLQDQMVITYSHQGPREKLIIHLINSYQLSSSDRNILRKAGVEPYQNKIVFTNYLEPHSVYVVKRSGLGILNYLSKGVLIPPADAQNGVITQTLYPDGKVFDWQLVVHGMMMIKYSSQYPSNASVAVPYRGRWYYIDDRDADSKQTLIMLTNILGLMENTLPNGGVAVGLTRNA